MSVEPLAKFRVYGWKSSLYFLVHVWPTKKAMLANRKKEGLRGSCDAHVMVLDHIRYIPGRPRRLRPIVGEMHFFKGKLGTEVITHESFHATVGLLRRLRFQFSTLDQDSDGKMLGEEELAAYTIGHLARSIVTRLYDFKLIS